MDLNSLNLIEKFIVEHGSAAVMGVHISYLRDQLADFHRVTTDLRSEVADLKATNENLNLQMQLLTKKIHSLKPAGFVEGVGVFWKRTATGFDPFPYCKECSSQPVMTYIRQMKMFVCPHGHHAPPSPPPTS